MKKVTLKNAFYFVPIAMFFILLVLMFPPLQLVSKHDKYLIAMGFAAIGLFYIIVYCNHLSKNDQIENKGIWYFGLIFLWGITSILYFFKYIIKKN